MFVIFDRAEPKRGRVQYPFLIVRRTDEPAAKCQTRLSDTHVQRTDLPGLRFFPMGPNHQLDFGIVADHLPLFLDNEALNQSDYLVIVPKLQHHFWQETPGRNRWKKPK